jgi:aquaporin Z
MNNDCQCSPAEAVRMFAAQLVARPTLPVSGKRATLLSAKSALAQHWPEYLIEAVCLGIFMVSACFFTVLLAHPDSPLRSNLRSNGLRRFLSGLAMGLTAVAIIYSPLGRRSGAHMNPAVTLTFFRLGKVQTWDALFYGLSQFAGGITGTVVAFAILRSMLAHRDVAFAVTMPRSGQIAALVAEAVISFLMMTAVLSFSNRPQLARYTGLVAGTLVMLFITFESPISGMSMNPARSFASDFVAMQWGGIWIYFIAPVVGMLTAAEVYVRTRGTHAVICAKLNHSGTVRCIFRCGYMTASRTATAVGD